MSTDDDETGRADRYAEYAAAAEEADEKTAELGRGGSDALREYDAQLREEWGDGGETLFHAFLGYKVKGGAADGTISAYETVFKQWREHMAADDGFGGGGRHPAAPSRAHVSDFIERHRQDNKVNTVKTKVANLKRAFEWFIESGKAPFTVEESPFTDVWDWYDWGTDPEKSIRRLTLDEVREGVHRVTHLRDRAMMVVQFKLGLRAGEVRNMQLQDLSLSDPDLRDQYDELATNPHLRDGQGEVPENAVIIPNRENREGNKSKNRRIMPLDVETRRVLVAYLLMRPDDGEPWVFLSKNTNGKIRDKDGLNPVWRQAFPRDEWGETDTHRAVKPHYGRFFFTNYWNDTNVFNREQIQYMRGDDEPAPDADGSRVEKAVIDQYIGHSYGDVAETYRNHVFSLGLA